jgi:hypothetical protein
VRLRAIRFPANQGSRIAARKRRAYKCVRSREISGFHHLSPVLALVGRPFDGAAGLAACEGLVCRLSNGCVIVCCGFGDLAFDSVRGRRTRGTNRLVRCPHRQSRGRLELCENIEYKQHLAEKLRSQTRVICATPFGKGAESGCWEWFLCCVCRSPR